MALKRTIKYGFIIYLCCHVQLNASCCPRLRRDNGVKFLESTGPNVVIIGAGIGGASCAYYLKQWLPNATITILEADDRIGGRIQETVIDGVQVEVGADAWATSNRYISELVKELHLPTDIDQKHRTKQKADGPLDSLVIWNGKTLTLAGKVLADSLLSDAEILAAVSEFIARLELNYLQRDSSGKSFHDLNEYLASDGNLWEYVNVSSATFYGKHGVSNFIQSYGIEAILRDIYGQNLTSHIFASLVGLTSLVESGSSVLGGNSQLPKALINASKADIKLNSLVTSVSKDSTASNSIVVTYDALSPKTIMADVVAVAAPLEWIDIKFNGFPAVSKQPNRTWAYWYVHHISAKSLNNKFFNQPPDWSQPSVILTTNNASTPWASIQFIDKGNSGLNIYKLFCFQNVTSLLDEYFVGVKTVHVKHWNYTFPDLIPVQNRSQLQDIDLSGVYNINAMESIASAMEGSVISARNVAMMIKERWS